MKIALGQIRIKANNPQENMKQMLRYIEDAKKEAVDLIIFPELSIPGVYVQKRNITQSFIQEVLNDNQKIIDASDGIAILFGSYHFDGALYNAAFYAKDQKLIDIATKSNLACSRFEEQIFTPQKKTFTLWIDELELTVSLDELKENTLFITSHLYKHDQSTPKLENSILVSGVGIYNTQKEVFGINGNSYFNYHGYLAQANPVFESELLIQDTTHLVEVINVETNEILPFILPMIEMFDEEHLSFKPKWLVGVSGGLDSSVSFALLVLALGSERVHGVTMPGAFTRDITLSNAYHLAQKLEASFEEIPIGQMVDATLNSLEKNGYHTIEGLSHENIQARLRGHTLMSVASLVNGVVCNNGNKIETALGYATIYGDAIGALSILGDLTKLEVGQLANEINEAYEEEVIPHNLIPTLSNHEVRWDFAPSAELSQDQFDPFKWGYHDHLVVYLLSHSVESVLEMYLDKQIAKTNFGQYMAFYGVDEPKAFIEDLEWLIKNLNNAIFKRMQTPPLLRVSKQGFGLENQANLYQSEHYKALKEKILA